MIRITTGRAWQLILLVGGLFLVCLLFGWNGARAFVIGSTIFLLLLIVAIRVVPSAEDEPAPPPSPPPPPSSAATPASAAAPAPIPAAPILAATTLLRPFTHQFGQEIRRVLFFETLVLAGAMYLQWRAYGWLVVHRTQLPSFVPTSEFALHALGIVAALAAAVVCVLLLLVPAIILVIYIDYWNLADSPAATPQSLLSNRWTRSMHRAVSIVLGMSQGTIILEKGKLYQPNGQQVAVCAGPAFLDVREAQVAVIETRGRIDKAVGVGRYWLAGNQRVTGVTDLNTQHATVVVEDVATHDGMIINRLELAVIYSMGLGNVPQPPGGRRTYYPSVVLNELWRDTPETYKRTVTSLAENATRTVIGDYDLRDVVILPSSQRVNVCQAIAGLIQRIIASESRVIVVNIGRVELTDEASRQLADRWVAEMEKGTGKIRAEMAKETLILKGEGQAEAVGKVEQAKSVVRDVIIKQLTASIYGGPGAPIAADPQLATRYLQAIEVLTGHLATDDVHAWQLVEALEEMARSGKAVNFYVGEDSMLVKQQRRVDEEPS